MLNQRTVAELVADVAQQNGTKTALIFEDEIISYADLDIQIEKIANALAAHGIEYGNRIAMMVPNIPQFIIAYYAIIRLGAIVVPVNISYKEAEVTYILQDSEATMFIFFEDFFPQVQAALKQAVSVQQVIVIGQSRLSEKALHWNTLIDHPAPLRERVTIKPEDVAMICYTSGTTGHAKGAILTHHNLITNCQQMDSYKRFQPNSEDILLLVIPLYHIYALNCGLNYLLHHGATIVLARRFEPIPILEQLQKHGCTIFLGAPPMYIAWANFSDIARYDLSKLRFVNSGAASLPMPILERFKVLTGIQINEGYGLTETSPTTHSNIAGPWNKPGSIGPAIPGVDARLVNDAGQPVLLGQEGELVVRGENVMLGYWRQPEATAEVLRDGWFHTGDIATIDDDQYYTIIDRKKDMINVGGLKVWPREVEDLLHRHPAVLEAAVVSIPDAYNGERPLAYIVLRLGQTTDQAEIIQYCKERLANYKAPRSVIFRTELPKLATGKVLRRTLREEAWQHFATRPQE